MLRGHIDLASRSMVQGWIWTDVGSLRDHLVLAFIGKECVGQGAVGIFRQDLADAGLGDGWSGFSVSVQLAPHQDFRAIVIRLDDSDMYLLPTPEILRERLVDDIWLSHPQPSPTELAWLRAKGWVSERLYNQLRLFSTFGVLEFSLREGSPVRFEDLPTSHLTEPVEALFDHIIKDHHSLTVVELLKIDQVSDEIEEFRRAFPLTPPVLGFWTAERLTISVVEGSYYRRSDISSVKSERGIVLGVEYSASEDTILVLNADSIFELTTSTHVPDRSYLIVPNKAVFS